VQALAATEAIAGFEQLPLSTAKLANFSDELGRLERQRDQTIERIETNHKEEDRKLRGNIDTLKVCSNAFFRCLQPTQAFTVLPTRSDQL
jgi:hypothetical protein